MPELFKFFLRLTLLILFFQEVTYGQSIPAVTYPSPLKLSINISISPVLPKSAGGNVFPANYSTPQIFVDYNTPFSIASDAGDNIYTSNNTTGEVSKYSSTGLLLLTINTGSSQASEVAVDAGGNLYVSQFTENKVLKYNSTGKLTCSIDGFDDPYGIAFDSKNNAYVANYKSGSISKIAAGDTVATDYIVGLKCPYGLAFDDSDNLFVSEQGEGDLIKIDAKTQAKTVFATGFNGPRHLSKDKFNNIYVADFGNGQIVKVDQQKNKFPILTNLDSPRQCAVIATGDLFFADFGSNTLRKAAATAYSISSNLPDGLSFDVLTGQITGTALRPSPLKTYTITAYNTFGSSTFPLALSVDSLPVKSILPDVSIGAATNVLTTSATLNGSVDARKNDVTVNFNYYSNLDLDSGKPPISVTINSAKGGNLEKDSLSVINLQPATKYYYFMKVTGAFPTIYSDTLNFITAPLPKSKDADLSSINFNSQKLTPVFSPNITGYELTIPDTTSILSILAAPHDNKAEITIDNEKLLINGSSTQLQQVNNLTKIDVVVTAEDGITKKTYTIRLNKINIPPAKLPSDSDTAKTANPLGNNANLALLSSGLQKLNPVFSPDITEYHITVADTTSSLPILAIPYEDQSKVEINGQKAVNHASSLLVKLNGNKKIIIKVTAPDSISTKTYSINIDSYQLAIDSPISEKDSIKHPLPTDNNSLLASLFIENFNLNPTFSSETLDYSITLPTLTNELQLLAKPADLRAKVTINGILDSNFNFPVVIKLEKSTTISLTVLAPDGVNVRTYTLNIINSLNSNIPPENNPDTNSGHNNESSGPIGSGSGNQSDEPDKPEIGKPDNSGNNKDPDSKSNTIPDSGSNESHGNHPINSGPNANGVTTDGDQLLIHPAVSPNGDGKNDIFQIEGLQKYPENKVTILNLNGIKIYEANGYDNSNKYFDGHSNLTGGLVKQGTYYYQLEYKDNQQMKRKLGYLILKY